MISRKNKNKKKATRKNSINKIKLTSKRELSNNSLLDEFKKEITVIFLQILLMVKLFHWKTSVYATHKATDELYNKLNEDIDNFIEVLLGKSNSRINLTNKKHIQLVDLSSQKSLEEQVQIFKSYLVNLNNNKAMQTMNNTDLFNIRDTILGNLNQFLYLLTLK